MSSPDILWIEILSDGIRVIVFACQNRLKNFFRIEWKNAVVSREPTSGVNASEARVHARRIAAWKAEALIRLGDIVVEPGPKPR
jgi:hypothetical protein